MAKQCPCYKDGKDCPERRVTKDYNCHSECPDFRLFRQELDEENAAIRKKKADEAMMDDVRFQAIKKVSNKANKQTAWKG